METRGFWVAAQAEPDRRALVEADGRAITMGELLAACNRVVHGLRAQGLEHGDCIATLLPNGAPAIEVLLAAMQAGWTITPINTNLAAPEIAYILADSGARALVGHAAYADKCIQAADGAGLPAEGRIAVGDVPGFRAYAGLVEGQPDARPEDRLAGQFMQYTSGTTGRPKGIVRDLAPIDPDTMARLIASHLARFDITPNGDHVHLCTSPMYHTAPLAFSYFSLNFEHPVVLMARWDPEVALQLIERHRVTTTHMVPTQFHRLLLLPEEVRNRYDVSSLRHVLHAAAPCPIDVKRKMFEWWGPVIYEYYGATEGGGALVKPEAWLRHPGTVGRAWEGADIRILDDEGAECPPGQPGTVYMKVLQDFAYKGDEEKTRAGRRGGFFTVGDIGYLNDEGYLFLCDRKIDMISEILDHCGERLAKYKCPRTVDFTDAMPRDPNGKLYKRKLRDPYWEGRERAI